MSQQTATNTRQDHNLAVIKQWLIDELSKYGELELSADNDVNYVKSGLLDSMNCLKFLVRVQKRFQVSLNPEQIVSGDIATVSGLALVIESSQAS